MHYDHIWLHLLSCSKAYFHLPVGEQEATGHTWQTEEVLNMIMKIQVQVLKQMQPNVIIMHTNSK
jgi:hypothetical protein